MARPEEQAVVVVGAGIAGCCTALALARRGLRPLLVERGGIARQGASAVPVALLNPYRGRSARARPEDLRGLAAFWELAQALEKLGLEHGARRSGVLRPASSERQARGWRRLEGPQWLDSFPAPYRAPFGGLVVEDGGWLRPATLLAALAAATRAAGGAVLEGCAVQAVERSRPGFLLHHAGGRLRSRAVVLCLGAAELPGLALPRLQRIAGDLVELESPLSLPRPVAGPVYLAGEGGELHVGGNHRPAGESDPHAPELLRASADRLVPGLAQARIAGRWTGVRARTVGAHPLAAELEPGLWYLGALAGRGFLAAPLLAQRLAWTVARRGSA